jgi:hypothetical protein
MALDGSVERTPPFVRVERSEIRVVGGGGGGVGLLGAWIADGEI